MRLILVILEDGFFERNSLFSELATSDQCTSNNLFTKKQTVGHTKVLLVAFSTFHSLSTTICMGKLKTHVTYISSKFAMTNCDWLIDLTENFLIKHLNLDND